MPTEIECFAAANDKVQPLMARLDISTEESAQTLCFTTMDEFAAIINPALVDFFFPGMIS